MWETSTATPTTREDESENSEISTVVVLAATGCALTDDGPVITVSESPTRRPTGVISRAATLISRCRAPASKVADRRRSVGQRQAGPRPAFSRPIRSRRRFRRTARTAVAGYCPGASRRQLKGSVTSRLAISLAEAIATLTGVRSSNSTVGAILARRTAICVVASKTSPVRRMKGLCALISAAAAPRATAIDAVTDSS